MASDETRLDKVEQGLISTQANIMLIHKDLQQVGQGINDMAASMKVMADLQINQRVMEERCESRHQETKASIITLHERIDEREEDIKTSNKNNYYLLAIVVSAMISYVVYANGRYNSMGDEDSSIEKTLAQHTSLIAEHTKELDAIRAKGDK